jgi:glycosyltransferase involved in cell wall biosynthesis
MIPEHSTAFSKTTDLHVQLPSLSLHPKVSVLITNYNYEDFLGRAIESVLAQSWPNFEIIVSDDGSDDGSCELAKSYARRGHPVILVCGPHRGMAGCLNAAFEASSGEIICLLDADDYFVAHKLESVVSAFRSNSTSGFCVHRTQRVDSLGRLGGAFPLLQILPSGDCTEKTIRNSGILMGLPPTSALSLRREVANLIFPIPESFTGYAEQMIHRIAPMITPLCAIDETLCVWMLHTRNDANCSQVKAARIEREIKLMNSLWEQQHRFLLHHNPNLARYLSPLIDNALYVKMMYIFDRLSPGKDARCSHARLCGIAEIRKSYVGIFWRYSNRLPGPLFRRSIDLLETQGSFKQLVGRLVHRSSATAS